MPRIGLLFELRHVKARHGETVRIIGDWPELGSWDSDIYADVDAAPKLEKSSHWKQPFRWSMRFPVWLVLPGQPMQATSSGAQGASLSEPRRGARQSLLLIEYKFVRDGRSSPWAQEQPVEWESDAVVRHASLPLEDGSVWIVSESAWDSCSEPAQITRATHYDLHQRLQTQNTKCFASLRSEMQAKFDPTPWQGESVHEINKRLQMLANRETTTVQGEATKWTVISSPPRDSLRKQAWGAEDNCELSAEATSNETRFTAPLTAVHARDRAGLLAPPRLAMPTKERHDLLAPPSRSPRKQKKPLRCKYRSRCMCDIWVPTLISKPKNVMQSLFEGLDMDMVTMFPASKRGPDNDCKEPQEEP